MSNDLEVQRSLGRIENAISTLSGNVETLFDKFSEHKTDDATKHQSLQSQIDAIKTAKAVLRGQLTFGQKVISYIGAFALFAISIFEFVKHR